MARPGTLQLCGCTCGQQTHFGALFQLNRFPQAPRSPTMFTFLPCLMASSICRHEQHALGHQGTKTSDNKDKLP